MRILILGDGNFSFTLAFCRHLDESSGVPYEYLGCSARTCDSSGIPSVQSTQNSIIINSGSITSESVEVLATSFDTREQLLGKYPETKEILAQLSTKKNVSIMHSINAWELDTHFSTSYPDGFDYIIWNHPHLGTEDFRLHRFLMAHFFKSVASVLKTKRDANYAPTVCISFVSGQESRWDIVEQAKRSNLFLQKILPFDETLWPGYVVKRNKNGKSFKNGHTKSHMGHVMKSHLFHFGWSDLNNTVSTLLDMKDVGVVLDEIVQSIPFPARRKVLKEANYECTQCQRKLATEQGLKNHIHAVHNLKLYGDNWKNQASLEFKCLHCPKAYSSKYALFQHHVNIHTDIDSCELPKAHSTIGDENENELDSSDYNFVPCNVCGQAVSKKSWGMLLHLETLKPIIGLDMCCPCCSSTFIEQRALYQHYKFCRLATKNKVKINTIQRETVHDIYTII